MGAVSTPDSMETLRRTIRDFLARVRRPSAHAARLATRLDRTTLYGLDLVLWSRLLASRRSPIPIELPRALMETKDVRFTPPVLHVSGPSDLATTWEEGFAAVHAALFLNLQVPDVLSRHRYAHPAPAFRGVYLWDSAFIAQIWKNWDLRTAREILTAVMALRDGDRLQHVVADFVSSPYTQPPLVAWSLARLVEAASPDDVVDFELAEAFDVLDAFNGWLQRERRHEDGLYFWLHPYESGVENSPRFGTRDERNFIDTRQYAAPDLCACVILQHEALARLAEKLDRPADAARHAREAERLAGLVDARLWDERDGFYYDRRFSDGAFLRSRTIAGLMPLWAGVPGEDRARRLVEESLHSRGFGTPIPLPSVSRDDPGFELDMWRGPVWVNTAYAVILGLERYGFEREAAEVAWRLCDGVFRTHAATRRIHEFYDPEIPDIARLNRKLGNRWKKLTLGNKPRPDFAGWSGLVNSLVIEHLVGFHRDATGAPAIRPRFPAAAAGLGFSLRLPSVDAALQIEIVDQAGTTRGTLRRVGMVRPFDAPFADSITFP